MVTAGSETRAELSGGGGVGEETCGRGDGGVRDPRRTEGEPSGGRARADEWERTMEELDESDIRACGGFLPLGRTGLASGTLETENGTGLGSGTLQTENGTGLAGGTLSGERHAGQWHTMRRLGRGRWVRWRLARDGRDWRVVKV